MHQYTKNGEYPDPRSCAVTHTKYVTNVKNIPKSKVKHELIIKYKNVAMGSSHDHHGNSKEATKCPII